jgi:hypothetical protein
LLDFPHFLLDPRRFHHFRTIIIVSVSKLISKSAISEVFLKIRYLPLNLDRLAVVFLRLLLFLIFPLVPATLSFNSDAIIFVVYLTVRVKSTETSKLIVFENPVSLIF